MLHYQVLFSECDVRLECDNWENAGWWRDDIENGDNDDTCSDDDRNIDGGDNIEDPGQFGSPVILTLRLVSGVPLDTWSGYISDEDWKYNYLKILIFSMLQFSSGAWQIYESW